MDNHIFYSFFEKKMGWGGVGWGVEIMRVYMMSIRKS